MNELPVPSAAIWAVLSAIAIVVMLVFLALFANYFWLWVQAVLTRCQDRFWDLIQMKFRKIDARTIVRSKIMAVCAGLNDPDLTTQSIQAHYMAGGNVPQVIRALIAARKSKQITLSFREAAAIDLAGRDVLDAFKQVSIPK